MNSGDIIASRYVLERPLAKGGMGAVWVARHLELDVRVALKVMAPEHVDTAFARDRFQREARACAQIQHPNVVGVHDYGVADGAPFLVMELLQGEDLQACLAREERLSLPAAIAVILPVCKGLRRAHELGIIHRDIKPSNVFLARQGDDTIVKILDFGVARIVHDAAGQTTRSGVLLGSPCYMSPEQARGRRVDHRSDLWSLAVVLYECLTGRLPFGSQALGELLIELCTEPVPPPTTVAPSLPAVVDPFFARALARNPDERFQSAEAFAEALASLRSGLPTLLAGPSLVMERMPSTPDVSLAQTPPPAALPTAPGVATTIVVSRPRAAKIALGIAAPVVLGLGALAAYRLSSPKEPIEMPTVAPAEPLPAQPPAWPTPTTSASSTPTPTVAPTPPESAPSAAPPPDTPRKTAPTSTPRATSKRPSPPSPVPTRDPTFGF
ncbi:serine/threonine-protein kinase [Polyangium jinanense]|uniref:non-specific serine/threonine protein kinase n=1 Tax=Polyangium jinanense TaxID=2829994 RepID=A0A9X3XGG9_9BACT|nr:serine/threonine-protein kinase [Polyangium jinanense]MDC3961936.1 protein kinase [Polyangium jinanense]MDC3988663.1 protein kinase [Polyangium jinanense]